ncbi:hypothetical protein L1887_36437 [Cichorium endivia]|nr:hypothetical protein L1887_36437 [Cichorium endivia]
MFVHDRCLHESPYLFCLGAGAGFGFFVSPILLSSSVVFLTLSISSLSFAIASLCSLSSVVRNGSKRMKSTAPGSETIDGPPEFLKPGVVVDCQGIGIQLVHTLLLQQPSRGVAKDDTTGMSNVFGSRVYERFRYDLMLLEASREITPDKTQLLC